MPITTWTPSCTIIKNKAFKSEIPASNDFILLWSMIANALLQLTK